MDKLAQEVLVVTDGEVEFFEVTQVPDEFEELVVANPIQSARRARFEGGQLEAESSMDHISDRLRITVEQRFHEDQSPTYVTRTHS